MRTDAQIRGTWSERFMIRPVLCVFIVAISAALVLSYFDKRVSDRNRETEAAFKRIEARTQEIRNLEWLIVTAQEVSPEAEAQVETARGDLVATLTTLRPEAHNVDAIEQIRPAIANYLDSTA